jgi:hypothetical protein
MIGDTSKIVGYSPYPTFPGSVLVAMGYHAGDRMDLLHTTLAQTHFGSGGVCTDNKQAFLVEADNGTKVWFLFKDWMFYICGEVTR